MPNRDVDITLEGHDDTARATRSAGNNLDRLRRKTNRFNADTKKSFAKSGADGATAFFHSFLRGLTFGKLGATVDSKMGPQFARLGIRLGGVFAVGLAGAVLAQAGNIILAGLPLIIGPALLALPLIGILKKQIAKAEELKKVTAKIEALEKKIHGQKGKQRRESERELGVLQRQRRTLERQTQHLDTLKRKAKSFLDTISAPLEPVVFRLMDSAGKKLDKLAPKLRRMVKGLAPGFEKLVGGLMDGVIAFVEALEPAIPGINAGMKEWGKQAPKIGKGIGDAIAAILKDPKKVQDAVKNTADLLRGAADSAIDLAAALVTISQKYKAFSDNVDKFEQGTSGKGGPLGGMLNAVKRDAPKIANSIGHLGDRIEAKVTSWHVTDKIKALVHRIVAWFASLPGRAGRAVSRLWSSMKSHFDQVVSSGKQRAREARDGVVRFFKRIPGAAGDAVSGMWGQMKGAFQAVLDGVISFASKIAAKVREIIGLKAQASGNPGGSGGGSSSWSSGAEWAASVLGSGYRTGGATQVSVAAPVVNVTAMLDGRALDARIRTVIREANRGDAYRARIGRR
jgi:hypothetical protein